jgi:hypothetical protein
MNFKQWFLCEDQSQQVVNLSPKVQIVGLDDNKEKLAANQVWDHALQNGYALRFIADGNGRVIIGAQRTHNYLPNEYTWQPTPGQFLLHGFISPTKKSIRCDIINDESMDAFFQDPEPYVQPWLQSLLDAGLISQDWKTDILPNLPHALGIPDPHTPKNVAGWKFSPEQANTMKQQAIKNREEETRKAYKLKPGDKGRMAAWQVSDTGENIPTTHYTDPSDKAIRREKWQKALGSDWRVQGEAQRSSTKLIEAR